MPLADSSILVTPGTTATVATEVISAKHHPAMVYADAYGQIVGARNAYVVSDRRTVPAANAWLLSLYNDSTSTFVEVTKIAVSVSTSAAVTGLPRLLSAYRITIKSGGANATAVAFDTASPTLPPRIKAARRPTAATVTGTPLAIATLNPEEAGSVTTVEMFNAMGEEPILLRGQQGIGIQQDGTVITGLVSTAVYFRVRP